MLAGAAIIFFAYIGFDSVSTHAEEAKRPNRDVPIGIVASLLICTVLYIAVVAVLTGMVKYDRIDTGAGVSVAFSEVGLEWADALIAIAGVAGITSVLLVMMLSGPRVFLAMARDGMVPPGFFGAVHPKFRTPVEEHAPDRRLRRHRHGPPAHRVPAPDDQHRNALRLRRRLRRGAHHAPHQPRGRAAVPLPVVPLVPILGIVCCLILMFSLPAANWWRLIGWLAVGLFIYFLYSRKHTVLTRYTAEELRRFGASPGETIDKAVAGSNPWDDVPPKP